MILSNKYALNTGVPSAFSIDQLITHHVTVIGTQVVLFNQVENHFSRRFPAFALIIGRMGTNGKIFKGSELVFPEIVLQLLVDNVDIFQGKIASADTGLVSNDKKFVPKIL